MTKYFKYLRVFTATLLIITVVIRFISMLGFKGFDGPLAHYFNYTFELNKISLASLLALILFIDFEIKFNSVTKVIMRCLSALAIILTIIGFAGLTRQLLYSGWDIIYFQFYLFQLAYLLVAVLIFTKTSHAALPKDDHA